MGDIAIVVKESSRVQETLGEVRIERGLDS